MIERNDLGKLDKFLVAWSLGALLVSLAFKDGATFWGALCGVGLAAFNWLLMRFVVIRLAAAGGRLRFMIFLGTKTFLLLASSALLLAFVPINAVGFMIGISALVLAIFSYSFWRALREGSAVLRGDSPDA